MYLARLVFSQLVGFLHMHQFTRCVNRYNGNYHMKSSDSRRVLTEIMRSFSINSTSGNTKRTGLVPV